MKNGNLFDPNDYDSEKTQSVIAAIEESGVRADIMPDQNGEGVSILAPDELGEEIQRIIDTA